MSTKEGLDVQPWEGMRSFGGEPIVSLETPIAELVDLENKGCEILENLQRTNKLNDVSFSYFKAIETNQLAKQDGEALLNAFIGDQYQIETTPERIRYSQGSKEVFVKNNTFEVEYLDSDARTLHDPITPQETLEKVRALIVDTLRLGRADDFYVSEIYEEKYHGKERALPQALPAEGNPGETRKREETQKARVIHVLRQIDHISTIGNLSWITVVYTLDGRLKLVRMRNIHLGKELGRIKGEDLWNVKEAREKVAEWLRKYGRDSKDYKLRCQFGYASNAGANDLEIGTIIAPIYLFEISPKEENADTPYHYAFSAAKKGEVAKAFEIDKR